MKTSKTTGQVQTGAKAPPRRVQAERRRESMTLILDHAEALFARGGYDGVTLRQVSDEAGVDAGLMRYYFGDKEELFKAVFKRRAPIINELRLQAMRDYRESAKGAIELYGVVDAFVRPSFEKMSEDDGWRNYLAIVAYVNASRGDFRDLMSESFDHVAREFIEDLRNIFPQAPEGELFWSYHFLTGAFTYSLAQTGRVDRISGGVVDSGDAKAMAKRFPIALTAAIRAIIEDAEGEST